MIPKVFFADRYIAVGVSGSDVEIIVLLYDGDHGSNELESASALVAAVKCAF